MIPVSYTHLDVYKRQGYYYRLRGSFAALKDGAMEGFGPVTDGVLIE